MCLGQAEGRALFHVYGGTPGPRGLCDELEESLGRRGRRRARPVCVAERRAAAGASLWDGWAGAPVLTSACGVRPQGGARLARVPTVFDRSFLFV